MKPLYLVTFLCFIWLGDAFPQVGDLPAGLKPAKAFGAFEQAIVPGTEETTPAPPANARIPPNLSLRSRMMASLNSPAAENDHTQSQQLPNQEQDESTPKVPIILTKKKNGKKVTAINYTKYISTMTPPPGKDFALHSLVQTNLIDSKGRLLKGVKSVPIQVPASVETRNPKPRSFAKIVDDDADRIVPIKFTKAERKKYTE